MALSHGDAYLMFNAKIYVSGEADYTWMIFNTSTGYVVDLGRNDPPKQNFPPERQQDCKGRRIFPGFHDSHLHVALFGIFSEILSLNGCASLEEFLKLVEEYEKNNEFKWMLGFGWDHDLMGCYPTRDDVDKVCPHKPLFIQRVCGHTCVINSKALELVGFTKDTPDPVGGKIGRYPEGHPRAGEPNGVLWETASHKINELVKESLEGGTVISCIQNALKICAQNGITSAHSLEDGTWSAYVTMAENNMLPIRIFLSAFYTDRKQGHFPEYAGIQKGFLTCDRVKVFTDGSLGACTAAISVNYNNQENKGILVYPQDELNTIVKDITTQGFRLEMHAIGDAAAEAAIAAVEYAKVAPEKRPILTHCQILSDSIITKMKKLGMVANIQPQFVLSDTKSSVDAIPVELRDFTYPWKTLLDRGIHCAGGSDAPVETPAPLLGIYDAIFRPMESRNPAAQKRYRPEECLTVQQAVDLYTKDGAYATMRESDLGQLLPGFQADFVIIGGNRDVVDHPEDFCSATISETWVAGKRVFSE